MRRPDLLRLIRLCFMPLNFVTCFKLFIRIALCHFARSMRWMRAFLSLEYVQEFSPLLSCSLSTFCGMAKLAKYLINNFLSHFVFLKYFCAIFFFSVCCVFKVLFVLALRISARKFTALFPSLLPQKITRKIMNFFMRAHESFRNYLFTSLPPLNSCEFLHLSQRKTSWKFQF